MEYTYDFIFGAQYYRAPTPAPANWETDLKNFRENGFTHIKFWVQWRWCHRDENIFYFDDIDRLMDIAHKNGLKVTLNVIFDVAPVWFLNRYPESKMVLSDGSTLEPMTAGHRQIGGFPGVCYNHPQALIERKKFLKATVERYKNHPAMDMWDVWNEPEQCGPYRYPDDNKLACYCDNCRKEFIKYLEDKYTTIDNLNNIWGRCYASFSEVELPRCRHTYGDFIDYREFHIDVMTDEADWRLKLVKELDNKHPAYLHVVPNTSSIMNSVTGVDDFALAKNCDLFASTCFSMPIWSVLTKSAAKGKFCFNAECHVGGGTTAMHQKQIEYKHLVRELAPQIGMGINGFMFWQYRPEVLGFESPAWGMTKTDGSTGAVGKAATEFIKRLEPYCEAIVNSVPQLPSVAVWRGRKNELFSYCMHGNLNGFANAVEAYINFFYYNNYSCCVVDDERIKNDLSGIKLLVMPYCYEADDELLMAVSAFVKDGGTLLCEAHLGGYNADTNRHSFVMPGLGLSEEWGIVEEYTTSSYHLKNGAVGDVEAGSLTDDAKKALKAQGMSGGKAFAITTKWNDIVMGGERFACVKATHGEVIGRYNGEPVIVSSNYGKGKIIYCGTNLSQGKEFNSDGFDKFVNNICKMADVKHNPFFNGNGVHIDKLGDMYVVTNTTDNDVSITMDGEYKGIFTDVETKDCILTICADTSDIMVSCH